MLETSASSAAVAHTNQDPIPVSELAARQESRALCVNYIIAGSGCEAPAQAEWSYFLCRAPRSPFSCPARIEKPGQGEFLPERLFWRKQMCMLNLESTIKSTRLPSAIIFSTLRGCEISAKSQLHRPTAPQRMLGRCFVGRQRGGLQLRPAQRQQVPPAPARRARRARRAHPGSGRAGARLLTHRAGVEQLRLRLCPDWEPSVWAGRDALGTAARRRGLRRSQSPTLGHFGETCASSPGRALHSEQPQRFTGWALTCAPLQPGGYLKDILEMCQRGLGSPYLPR